jgi:hypothetical protein
MITNGNLERWNLWQSYHDIVIAASVVYLQATIGEGG